LRLRLAKLEQRVANGDSTSLRAFAHLKDADLRPIYHRIENRVQAHIYVAVLAFLIHRAIERKLKVARPDLSRPKP
jgi:transposase